MPINRRSITLMSSTGETMSLKGTAIKADSYYGYTDGLQTIQVTYASFIGKVRLQATLSLSPTEDDWFDIIPIVIAGASTFTTDSTGSYVQFVGAKDGSEAYTVQGNFAYLRVYMDRTDLGEEGDNNNTLPYGQIMQAVMAT